MASLVDAPSIIEAMGEPPKKIAEYIGRVNTNSDALSVAVMESPSGWSEPGQRPEFDEFSVVIDGELWVETAEGSFAVRAGQAVHAPADEWVRYSSPGEDGARYVSICLPAFSPSTVHRDG